MNPVPGHDVSTPYGRRGKYWSCDRNSAGEGIHTGADFAASPGTKVVAARDGNVVWCNHGSSFGNHQIEIVVGDTRDFYAHMRTRVEQGYIEAGEKVGEVGAEGNVTGPHLHFERHTVPSGPWSCGVITDPQPSIDWEGEDEMNDDDWKKLRKIVAEEVEKGWDKKMEVTQPDGDDLEKAREQVLRETYQTVKRLD